jgi:hypothetical protein
VADFDVELGALVVAGVVAVAVGAAVVAAVVGVVAVGVVVGTVVGVVVSVLWAVAEAVVPGISRETTRPRVTAAPVARTATVLDVQRTRDAATSRRCAAGAPRPAAGAVTGPSIIGPLLGLLGGENLMTCMSPCESRGPRTVS